MASKSRIRKSFEGCRVAFHGYDGNTYPATVLRVRRGIATLRYKVFSHSIKGLDVTAYIADASRLEPMNGAV